MGDAQVLIAQDGDVATLKEIRCDSIRVTRTVQNKPIVIGCDRREALLPHSLRLIDFPARNRDDQESLLITGGPSLALETCSNRGPCP